MKFLFKLCAFMLLAFASVPLQASAQPAQKIPFRYALFDALKNTYLFQLAQQTGADQRLFQTNPTAFAHFMNPDYTPEAFAPFTPKEFVYDWVTNLQFLPLAKRTYLDGFFIHNDSKEIFHQLGASHLSTNPWSMALPVDADAMAFDPDEKLPIFPYIALQTSHLTDLSYLAVIEHLVLTNSSALLEHMRVLCSMSSLRALNISDINFDDTPRESDPFPGAVQPLLKPAPTQEDAQAALGVLLETLPHLPHLNYLSMMLPLDFEKMRAPLIACAKLEHLIINGPEEILGTFFDDLNEAKHTPCSYYTVSQDGGILSYDTQNKCFKAQPTRPLSLYDLEDASCGHFNKTFEKEWLTHNWRQDLPQDLQPLPLKMLWSFGDMDTHDMVRHTLSSGQEIILGRPKARPEHDEEL